MLFFCLQVTNTEGACFFSIQTKWTNTKKRANLYICGLVTSLIVLTNGSNHPEIFQTVFMFETIGSFSLPWLLLITSRSLDRVVAVSSLNLWLIFENVWSISSCVWPTIRNESQAWNKWIKFYKLTWADRQPTSVVRQWSNDFSSEAPRSILFFFISHIACIVQVNE